MAKVQNFMAGEYTDFPVYNEEVLKEGLEAINKDIEDISNDLMLAELIGDEDEEISCVNHILSLEIVKEDILETLKTALN